MAQTTTLVVGASFAGIKAAWELRNRLTEEHRILLLNDHENTIIRASFPHVVFEDVSLDKMTIRLAENFRGTGIEFLHDPLVAVDQEQNEIRTQQGRFHYDYLVLATGARHAYEALPGCREHAISICDRSRILEAKEALLGFRGGEFYAGVGAGFTPCDGPPMEVLMGLEHRLRQLGLRDEARLHYITDKGKLLPPGGPRIWKQLQELFRSRGIEVHLNVELVRLDERHLYFQDGTVRPYDLCLLIPPFRGARALEGSGLTNERGFVPVDLRTMRADQSQHFNVYAVGDAIANLGPKQGHLALMQADVAAAHIAWRINRGGFVPAYLPEFKCVMDLGGGEGLYMYSQWMSDGDVVEIQEGREPYLSKARFEQLFYEKRGNVGSLHMEMMK
jgi:sulfide:quinone oxidoreductase